MTTGGQQCAYTHDVSTARFDDFEDDTWRCHRDRYEDTRYCPFHLPKNADAKEHLDYSRRLRSHLDPEDDPSTSYREHARFIGASLPGIDVRHAHLGRTSNAPIDLRECTVDGNIVATGAHIDRAVTLDGAVVAGDVRFDDVTIDHPVSAAGAEITGGLRFDDATVESLKLSNVDVAGRGEFRGTTVTADVDCHSASIERISFERTEIGGDVELSDLTTRGRLRLDESSVGGTVSMMRTTLPNGLWAVGMVIGDGIVSGDSTFGGPVHLDDAVIEGRSRLNAVRFDDRVSVRNARIDTLLASAVSFTERCEFDATRMDVAEFEHVSADDGLGFEGMAFERFVFRPNRIAGPVRLRETVAEHLVVDLDSHGASEDPLAFDLRGASVSSGRLGQPQSGYAVYDLSRATIGDVSLGSPADRVALECYRFERTTFDGFDFTDLRHDLDATQWDIHGVGDDVEVTGLDEPGSEERAADSPTALETTYLKAKNGAKELGDDQAVSRFFRKEMRYRRHRHWERARSASAPRYRLRAVARGVYNGLLAVTTGHGELSRRVVYSSVATVLAFAVLYRLLFADVLPATDGVLGYVIFSSQTFITFIVDSRPIETPVLLRVLTVVEGFIGAFFVALFVFTLTRSVNR
jgi:hypothetical protein